MGIPIKMALRAGLLVIVAALVSGCATRAALTVMSQPEGAFITEKETGNSYGTTPVVIFYDSASLPDSKDSDGCYLVKGFDARWVSGTSASLDTIRLCGKKTGDYTITFNRDPEQPDLEKDLQFALQVQALRAQQKQAQAARDAAKAEMFSAWANMQRRSVNCTSVQIGNVVRTHCR
ncbi:hypothetical protein ACFL43_03560 [Thermodesulfobacteriota bacterium]